MNLLMPKLTTAANGDSLARKVIPADVRDAYQLAYGVRQEERFRCPAGTSQSRAKIAFAEWLAEIEGRISRLRATAGGESHELTHKQMYALVGRWHEWFLNQYDENPLTADAWDNLYERYEDAFSAFASKNSGLPEEADGDFDPRQTALVQARIQEIAQLPTFLALESVNLARDSMQSFTAAVGNEIGAVTTLLRRRAEGDYQPSSRGQKFPLQSLTADSVKLSGWNAWEAFEAWVMERKPATSTVNRWRVVFDSLNGFLDGRDIALMTDEEAVAWKDKLTGTGAGGRTINEIWLTGARTIFNWVKRQKRLSANPFDGVRVAVARSGPTRDKFRDEDAETILKATLRPLGPRTSDHLRIAARWVPWLCAYTGARSGEMTQLRKQDIEQHKDGFWTLRITPDAGTVKGSMPRTVVLHDHLIEQGFVEFVSKAKPGPLFYDPQSVKADREVDPLNPPRPPYVIMRQKLADWVRKQGVTDPGVGPNHGWRHTFRRRAARAKMEERIRDAFCGHTDPKVARRYELPDLEELAEAIKSFPRYPIDTPKHPL